MSATMISYDAQMFDYSGDADVHMHTTFSSPKAWLQAEAPMDDDIEPLSAEPIHSLPEDVEVDMEPAYGDGVEYEMQDDVGDDGDGGGTESVDVDFVDAELDDGLQPAPDLQQETTPLEPPVDIHAGFETSAQDAEASHLAVVSPSLGGEVALPTPEDVPRSNAPIPAIPTLEANQDEAHSNAGNVDSTYIDYSDETRPEPFDGPGEGAHEETELSDTEGEPSPVYEIADHMPSQDAFPGDPSDAPSVQPSISHDDSGAPPGEVSASLIEEAESSSGHEEERYYDEHHEDDDDPHEITDGIYIDPPPAVLVDLPDLPSSSEKAEYSLFSHRFDGSSSSLHETASTSAISRFTVLFDQQPALYYERLSEVFDALRKEEQIQRLADLAEGELVIDAYDLQLEVSEDNVHAREVTLHDLNNLHDGAGLPGPLRIRLRCRTPRFINKYNLLREQGFHLAIAEEDAEVDNETEEVEYYKQENYDVAEENEKQSYDSRNGDSFSDGEDEHTQNDATDDQDRAKVPHSEPRPDDLASSEGDVQVLNNEGKDRKDSEGAAREGDLDSATVHAHVDTDGSGEEATEYATFVEPHEEDEMTGDVVAEEALANQDESVAVDEALASLEDGVTATDEGVNDDASRGVEVDAEEEVDSVDAPTSVEHYSQGDKHVDDGVSSNILPYPSASDEDTQTFTDASDPSVPHDYTSSQFETDLPTASTDSSIQTQADITWDTIDNTDLDESFDEDDDLGEGKGNNQDDDYSDSTLSSITQDKAHGVEDAVVRPQSWAVYTMSSKRHFDEVDVEDDDQPVTGSDSRAESPNSKRARVD